MIMQAIQTLEEWNKTGIDNVLLYVVSTDSLFLPMMLTGIFLIILIGTYFGTRKYAGQADFMASWAAASTAVTIISLFLQLVSGFMTTLILMIVFGNFAISIILFLFSRVK